MAFEDDPGDGNADIRMTNPYAEQALKQVYSSEFLCHYCKEVQTFSSAPFGCRSCAHPPCNLCRIHTDTLAQLQDGLAIDVANSSQYYQPDPVMIAICCTCGLPMPPDSALSQPVKMGERLVYLSRTVGFQRATCLDCGHLCCTAGCLRFVVEKRPGFLPPVVQAGFPTIQDYENIIQPKRQWGKHALERAKSVVSRLAVLSLASTNRKIGSKFRQVSDPEHLPCANSECTICRYKYSGGTVTSIATIDTPKRLRRTTGNVAGLDSFRDFTSRSNTLSPGPYRPFTQLKVRVDPLPRRRASVPARLSEGMKNIRNWIMEVNEQIGSEERSKDGTNGSDSGPDRDSADSAYFSKD